MLLRRLRRTRNPRLALPHPVDLLAVVDRFAELPYRFRARDTVEPSTWPLDPALLARLRVRWPLVYEWEGARPIVGAVQDGLRRLGILDEVDLPQRHQGVVTLECVVDGRPRPVVLDYGDKPDVVSEDALARCDLYIKLQYDERGYADPRVVPGGYPVTHWQFYRFFRSFRNRQRGRPQPIDVLGRFGYAFQGELRRRAVAMLSGVPDIAYRGAAGKVRYSRFLREIAASKLSLHLPGNGPFTHRVAEYLAMGTCMVSPRFTCELHVPLQPGVHYVEIAPDLRDLVEVCRHYLAHPAERERIREAGRDYFDRYLHCDQMAAYHVQCLQRYVVAERPPWLREDDVATGVAAA